MQVDQWWSWMSWHHPMITTFKLFVLLSLLPWTAEGQTTECSIVEVNGADITNSSYIPSLYTGTKVALTINYTYVKSLYMYTSRTG